MHLFRIPLFAACLTLPLAAFASVVGWVRGVIQDPQHRPVQDAMAMIKAKTSDWSATANSDANGNFVFNAVPLGDYVVTVAGLGFEQAQQDVAVLSGSQPVLHFALNVAGAKEMINVFDTAEAAPTDSVTPTTVVARLEIARTPGATRCNSMAMITDFVPGASITHDELHIRGGHQTRWTSNAVDIKPREGIGAAGRQTEPLFGRATQVQYALDGPGPTSSVAPPGHVPVNCSTTTATIRRARSLRLHPFQPCSGSDRNSHS